MSECEICCLPCMAVMGCFGLCIATSRGPMHPCTRGCFSCFGDCCRERKNRDMDNFVSEVEREMAEERAKQQELVDTQPTSGPSMSAPRSTRSGEEERQRSRAPKDESSRSRDQSDRRSRIEQHERSERRNRHGPHKSHQYPPNPYPDSTSSALNRSKSDQRVPSSERRHMRETRSADFRQSAYDPRKQPENGDGSSNYPPAPYPKDPQPSSREERRERYDSEQQSSDRPSRALLSPLEQPAERSPQRSRERGDSRSKTSKYPAPMPNVPVVYTNNSREDRAEPSS